MKRLLSIASLAISCLGTGSMTMAQVTPDGSTSTTVNSNDNNNFTIEQGDRAGNNLFHSFNEFSLPNNGSAFFDNPTDIVNIFSRVTGGNISNIDGLIRANGSANLFLINPAGIIFGNNARLDIGGSFYGSSADGILFDDGTEFNANTANRPILTINAPIGLNLRDNPATIVNRSTANSIGLQVSPGETLALVGGGINFIGGLIISPGAEVNLGGLTETGIVSLDNNGNLVFPDGIDRADVVLTNGARVNVIGNGAGNIDISANNLQLSQQSSILAGIDTNNSQIGNIIIDATEDISIDNSSIANTVTTNGSGTSGNIIISAANLTINNGGQINASNFGTGDAGEIDVTIGDLLTIDGESGRGRINNSGISSVVEVGANGDSGNVNINTGNLEITNGGQISVSTFGTGNAGIVNVNASGNILLDGIGADNGESSLLSVVGSSGIGNAGGIEVNTNNLSLTNGSQVNASTFGMGNAGIVNVDAADTITVDGEGVTGIRRGNSEISSLVETGGNGNAGNLNLTARNLSISNGGQVGVSTFGNGNGGNANINVANKIIIDGEGRDNGESSILSVVGDSGIGNGGRVEVNTANLTIVNGGQISASAFGDGNGGNLTIVADSIDLDNGNILAANQPSSSISSIDRVGGNIDLDVFDRLVFDNNSIISARAGSNASGGNVNIDTGFIVAFPSQNNGNDILANATVGRGGNISINAEALLNIEQRLPDALTNDIDASSEFGLNGTVAIDTPEVDVLQGVNELPTNVIEADSVSSHSCAANRERGSNGLTVKGKGGIPPEPIEPINDDLIRIEGQAVAESNATTDMAIDTSLGKIYPARGILVKDDGTITLTAYPTSNVKTRTPVGKIHCDR